LEEKKMDIYRRRSPVSFSARPVKTETRDHWSVVLEYDAEEDGPYLVDLSHRDKWDVQDGNLDEIRPWEVEIPKMPGASVFAKGMLVSRLNRTQTAVWFLSEKNFATPESPAFTDVTEASVLLALIGRDVFSIIEKLTAMDLADPKKTPPFLLQGPLSHVPCKVAVLDRAEDRAAVLLACSRGYAHDMVDAILKAGDEFGLRPAGENAVSRTLESLSG
jgi:hypothetical protein